MAYITPIHIYRCSTCGRQATQELRNNQNAPINWYCDRHADQALAEFRRDYE